MAAIAIVSGCADCPLCAETVASWGYELIQNVCQHPDAKNRNVVIEDGPKPTKPPPWCPLRIAALPVRLATRAPAPPKAPR